MAWRVDVAEVKAKMGHRVALMGNVPPLDLGARETPEEVALWARRCLDQGAPGGGMILSFGGGVCPGTRPENIDALVRPPGSGRRRSSVHVGGHSAGGPPEAISIGYFSFRRTDVSIEAIYDAVLDGNEAAAKAEVQAALDARVSAADILHQGCIAAMIEVGRMFEEGEKYVPEMLISARAMKAGLAILQPHLVDAGVEPVGKVVLGTVKGDLHDIGKNLVGMMLEGVGFEVIDLGVDVAPEAFVEAVRAHRPDFVGLSALLTTTMPGMQAAVDALQEAGLRDGVAVMVGGAPVTQSFAEEIGADLFAPDASSAASQARALLAAD
jgi:5-methyltetrahydrofolate--homocysteine methyltransferase